MFKRILFGYLAVLLISFAVLTLFFSFTVRQYLINDTLASLNRVAETLSASPMQQSSPGNSHMMRRVSFNIANRIAYADYLIIDQSGTIIDSSDQEVYPPGSANTDPSLTDLAFNRVAEDSLVAKDLVAVAFPVSIAGSRSDTALILYAHLDLLTQLNRSLLKILAVALAIGITISVIAGALATRVVVRPLRQLKIRAAELASRQFTGKLEIKTGDEIEELATSFNEMANRLAEYDRVQKEFFQKASHELKTPLMSVQGYAEAIKEGIIPPEETEQGLAVIISESRRMKALVDEYLYLSKVESLSESYRFEKVSLTEAVSEAVHAIKSLALEKGLGIEIEDKSSVDHEIDGDPEKIHRLLLNVLSNALRYANSEVTIKIGDQQIIIEDDGPGFNEEEKEKSGSGLGLTISQAIIEKHGGTIEAGNRSTGSGARVSINF